MGRGFSPQEEDPLWQLHRSLLSLANLPTAGGGLFPLRAREGLGEVPDRAEWQWVSWSGTHLPPPPRALPQPDIQAPSSDPQLGPDPQPPSPSSQGLVGAA